MKHKKNKKLSDKSESKMKITKHAQKRFQQRGRSEEDILIIRKYGTKIRDGFVLKKNDAVRAANQLRRENNRRALQKLDHLIGWRIVVCENTLVTTYPITRRIYRPARRACRWRGGKICFMKGEHHVQ